MMMTREDIYKHLLQNIPVASAVLNDNTLIYAGPVKITVTEPKDSFNKYTSVICEICVQHISSNNIKYIHALIDAKTNLKRLVNRINRIIEEVYHDD